MQLKKRIVRWMGLSFEIYRYSANWNRIGGIYIFASWDSIRKMWVAHYIGQTRSFKQRMFSHPKWERVRRTGATHVHARIVSRVRKRLELERKLIAYYEPPLNRRKYA